jgi:hypothetical protein
MTDDNVVSLLDAKLVRLAHDGTFLTRLSLHYRWMEACSRAVTSAVFAVVVLSLVLYSGSWFAFVVFFACVGMEWWAVHDMTLAEQRGGGPNMPWWEWGD